MTIKCIWEHNGNDTLLHAVDFVGAYTRGESLNVAISKMAHEIKQYATWSGEKAFDLSTVEIIEEKESDLDIKDADSDVIFETEKRILTVKEYERLKELSLKSAKDFLVLYQSIFDKNVAIIPERKTFYGNVPRTAAEMYEHTKNVNAYYFSEIDVKANNAGNIFECRKKGFEVLEKDFNYLDNKIVAGSYGEDWSLRKVFRRFIWHDRIHAKAMYRMAVKLYGKEKIADPFYFSL